MNKIFPIVVTILSVLFPVSVFAQEETTDTEVVEDSVTTSSADATTEEDAATAAQTEDTDEQVVVSDETSAEKEETTTDETIGIEETTAANTEDTEKSTSASFLEGIDTMWLWVILGIGAVVLVGSLIGILSLSKKEKKGDQPDEKTEAEEAQPSQEMPSPQPAEEVKEPEIQESPASVPVQENQVQQTQPQQEPTSAVEPESSSISIQDTLGDTATYKQENTTVVSNEAPSADIEKDLADLNSASPQQMEEPQPSVIETASVTPEMLNNQETVNPAVEPAGMNMMGDMQTQAVPENPAPTPMPDSIVTPQKPDMNLAEENLSTEGINQPIDTTSL